MQNMRTSEVLRSALINFVSCAPKKNRTLERKDLELNLLPRYVPAAAAAAPPRTLPRPCSFARKNMRLHAPHRQPKKNGRKSAHEGERDERCCGCADEGFAHEGERRGTIQCL
jgi:hypothetical protein